MRLRLWALAAAAAAAFPPLAVAQEGMPAIQPSRRVDLGATLQAYYDSNITRSSRELARTRGLEREDYVVRPVLAADIVRPLGRQAIFIQGLGGYDFHRNNERLNSGQADITVGYMAALGPCQPMVYGNYVAQRTDLADTEEQLVKNVSQSVGVAAGIQCSRNVGPSGMILARRQDLKNSAEIQEVSDYTTETLITQLTYNDTPIGSLGAAFIYSSNEFPNRVLAGRAAGDGFTTRTYTLSIARELGARAEVSASAGWTHLKREFAPPGQKRSFTSSNYAGLFRYRVGNRLDLEASVNREIRPTVRTGKLYDLETFGQVQASYRLSRRSSLKLGHEISDVDSNADTAAPGPVVTKSRTNSTFASLEYHQSGKTTIVLDVRQEDRKADLPEFNYELVRVGVTATTRF